MPSIRSCIASIAIMAMAFSPIAAAASPKTGSLVARSANNVARSQIKASAALARRAANKQKRAGRAARVVKGKGTPAATTPSADPYAADSKFLNTKAALAAKAVRCGGNGGDDKCERAVGATAPANADAKCILGRCTFRCNSGFAPGGTSGEECVPDAVTCGAQTCPTVSMGFNKCTGSGASISCAPGCFDGNPPVQNTATGEIACLDYSKDPKNCGTYASNRVCPSAYSGEGSVTCYRGICGLACAAGTTQRFTSTGQLTCY